MEYGLLRVPHQNSRYYDATAQLMINEFEIISNALKLNSKHLGYKTFGSLSLFCFEVDQVLKSDLVKALQRMATSFALFEVSGEWLKPLSHEEEMYFKSDIASILKYSGKTNEDFTGLMINVGVFASDFAGEFDAPLTIFDPMSGRGTTLYKALMSGYNSTGVELQKQSCVEMNQYLKRYLKFHHYKHTADHQTIVQKGKHIGTKYNVITANDKEAFKTGDTRSMQFAQGDTLDSNLFHKKGHAHVLVTDLPYGVQHPAPKMMSLLEKASKTWFEMLKKGGVAVIAFNTYHLEKAELVKTFEKAGFKVLMDPVYDSFEHWVEQAVNRDILVLKK